MELSAIKIQFSSIALAWLSFVFIFRTVNCIRSKRTLAFTNGNSFGYLAAVAIPVDLPNRNIYVAFNLETNYGLPPNDTHYNLIEKWNLNGMFSDISNGVTNIESARYQRSLYTRTNFYRSVIGYMEHYGLNGSDCLLRTICEIAESSLFESNGLLGSIMHILFMPTSSTDEHISQAFYEAEKLGFKHKCNVYENDCPESFLNKISVLL